MPADRRLRAWKAGFLLVGTLLVCTLAFLAWRQRTGERYTSEGQLSYVADEASCSLGLAANTRATQHKHTRHGDLSWTVQTDRHGFRVDEDALPPPELPDPRCRVLALGDSFTMGSFVKGREAWPAALERELHARGYRRVRTLNGGLMGHTIVQERRAAARWRDLAPGVVIVQALGNDLDDLHRLLEEGCATGGTAAQTEFRPATQDAVTKYAGLVGGRGRHAAGAQRCAPLRQTYLDELAHLAREVAATPSHLLVAQVGAPTCESTARWDFGRDVRAVLAPWNGLHVVADDWMTGPEDSLRPLDSHPSARGHQHLAEGLADALARSGWLEECR